VSRQSYVITARFPSAKEAEEAFRQTIREIVKYCEQDDAEFDLDEFELFMEDDEVIANIYSWGGGVDDVEEIFVNYGAIKVVEYGEFGQRSMVYFNIERLGRKPRIICFLDGECEELKTKEIKGKIICQEKLGGGLWGK